MKELRKEMWVELSQLLPRVKDAFSELEDNAKRLAKDADVLCDLTPNGRLCQLVQQAAEVGATVSSESFQSPKPYTEDINKLLFPNPLPRIARTLSKKEFDTEFDPNPLTIFSQAVAALRWLVQCREAEPIELGGEVEWLLPRWAWNSGEIDIYPGGNRSGATRVQLARWLEKHCHRGFAKAFQWAEKAAMEVTKIERDAAEARANWNLVKFVEKVENTGVEILSEVKKGTKAAEGAEAEAKKARQGVQRLLVPAEAIFRKRAQGMIKWMKRIGRRKKYSDLMKQEVLDEVNIKRNMLAPLDVPAICKEVLKKHGYLTDDMPQDEHDRIIRNFQRAYEKYAKKLKKKKIRP